jgi:hypothetical protein
MTGMLERVTLVTTTGTGPRGAPRPPPPPKPPPPPPWPFCGIAPGWPARQTAYPATPPIISRKRTQISPRFFGFPVLGGIGPCSPGRCAPGNVSGADSGVFVCVVIQTPNGKRANQFVKADTRCLKVTPPLPEEFDFITVAAPLAWTPFRLVTPCKHGIAFRFGRPRAVYLRRDGLDGSNWSSAACNCSGSRQILAPSAVFVCKTLVAERFRNGSWRTHFCVQRSHSCERASKYHR